MVEITRLSRCHHSIMFLLCSGYTTISATPTHHNSSIRKSALDRKSTRLNSSHRCISYAVFCLKKKKTITNTLRPSGTDFVRIVPCGAGTAQSMRERVLAELYGRGEDLSW